MKTYNHLALDQKVRDLLPFYIHNYCSNYQQGPTYYLNGGFTHHLILTLEGEGIAEAGGEKRVLKPGDIFFYQEDVAVAYYPKKDHFVTCWINFNGFACRSLFEYYNLPEFEFFKNDKLALKLTELCHYADKGFPEEHLSVKLYSLLTDIATEYNGGILPTSFVKAISYIRNNYSKDLPVSEIAARSGISESLLYKQFRDYYGTTPVAYITSLRIDWAKYYLETHPTASIADVSRTVGFRSTSYFIESFKRLEGITPVKFRKRFYTNKH